MIIRIDCGDDDLAGWLAAGEGADQFQPGAIGQAQVHQRDVRGFGLHVVQRGGQRIGMGHADAGEAFGQRFHQPIGQRCLVFEYQPGFHSPSPSCGPCRFGGGAGRVKRRRWLTP
ncbi:MAG: hypothetical protein QM769_08405 [Pseudoxanthomonas sp.]